MRSVAAVRDARRWLPSLLLLLQAAPPVRGWTLLNLYHESLQAKTSAPYRDPLTDTPWDGPGAWNLSRIAVRWEPLHASAGASTRRLVSIAYALHPDMCSDWLEMPATSGEAAPHRRRFPEDLGFGPRFVTCDAVRRELRAGFEVWSSQHPLVDFYDVTDQCHEALLLRSECAHAQLVVRGMTPQEQRELDNLGLDLVAAVHLDRVTLKRARLTNGQLTTSTAPVVTDASMRFSRRHCFYLDTTFCAVISRVYRRSGQLALTLLEASLYFVLVLCGAYLLSVAVRVVLQYRQVTRDVQRRAKVADGVQGDVNFPPPARQQQQQQPGQQQGRRRSSCAGGRASAAWGVESRASVRARELRNSQGREASRGMRLALALSDHAHMCPLQFTAFVVVCVPAVLVAVIAPCSQCHDFMATTAHEAGHVLGFAHAGENALRELNASLELGTACTYDPLDRVGLMAPRAARAAADERVMGATALHRANTCLDDDTLRGLDALYPSCDVHTPVAAAAGEATPSRAAACVHRVGAAGLARLLLIVAIPYASISLALVLLHTIVQRYTGRAQEALRRRAQKARLGLLWTRVARRAAGATRAAAASVGALEGDAAGAGAGGKQKGAVPKASKGKRNGVASTSSQSCHLPGCNRAAIGESSDLRSEAEGRALRDPPPTSQNSAKPKKGGKQRAGGRAPIHPGGRSAGAKNKGTPTCDMATFRPNRV